MYKQILKQFLFIILLGFSTCLLANQKKVVETQMVSTKTISESVELIGTIKAKQATLLTAKVGGFVDYETKSGSKLNKGDLIAKLENTSLEQNYALVKQTEDLEKKQTDRLKKLSKNNASSENALESQYSKLFNAKKNVNQAKIELEQTLLTAPFDGVVGSYKVYEGTQVQSGTPVVHFYNSNDIVLEFNIPAYLLSKLTKDSRVKVNRQVAKLDTVQNLLDPNTRMAPAMIKYKCNDCILGSSKKLELILSTSSNSIVVPFNAVFLRQGKFNVYGVKDSIVTLIPVELGIRSKDEVEIISGLKSGDQIVVKGHSRLYPGLEVTVKHKTDNL